MKFFKAMRDKDGFSMVEADGEPWEKNGFTFMLEIPKDVTDCEVYDAAVRCGRCIMRHEYPCPLDLCRATEKTSGLLAATAGSKSALVRALNRLNYDDVKKSVALDLRETAQPIGEE